MDLSYPIKWVQYFDRAVPVFVQNLNGPCPLLAIANVLTLRNQLYVMPGATSLSQSRLISMVRGMFTPSCRVVSDYRFFVAKEQTDHAGGHNHYNRNYIQS